MIHPPFTSASRGMAMLAVVFSLAVGARAAEPNRDVCWPVRAEASPLPDLQQGAHALCRALLGDREPGALSERSTLRIRGWADASYQDTDRDDGNSSLDLDHANLVVDARLDERWQLFFEGEWEHEPDLESGTDEREWELEQLYGEYRHTDSLRLRVGRLSTPFGHWTPLHWSILVDTIEPPIHERTRLVPEQQIGARLHGRLFADALLGMEATVDYSLFGGYAEEGFNAGNADGLTLGSDTSLRIARAYQVGVSLYTQKNGDEGNRRENNVVLYGEAQLPWRLFTRAEYVRQRRDSRTRPGLARDIDVVYAKLRWDLRDDTYLNYRFEFGDDDRFGFTVDHEVHRVTLGYRPIARIFLKAEWARHIYARPSLDNYHYWGASAGLFF